jgi:multicomponent Na+:H+ antiporter subunit G
VHAAGVTETLAAPLLLCGLMLQMEWSLDLVKVLMILLFVLATNPTATQAMAKATLTGGQKPLVAESESTKGDSPSNS